MQYCDKCKERLDNDARFCTHCGSPVDRQATPDVPQHEDNLATTPKPEKKKLSKKSLIVIISSCAAVIALAICAYFYFSIQAGKAASYDEALTLMELGDYSAAQTIFADLGIYQDAEELFIECQNRLDYYAAVHLMDIGSNSAAKEAFEALGAFRDSSALAIECQKIIDYNSAKFLMNSGRFSEAKAAFLALGNFRDSSTLASECQLEIDYGLALELMESEEYEQAGEMFAALGSFKDSEALAEECDNWIMYWIARGLMDQGYYGDAWFLMYTLTEIEFEDSEVHFLYCDTVLTYDEADKAYEDGLFYTAYRKFMSILHHEDSFSRAEECIQDLPSTGQIYRNTDFSGSAVSLRIRTPRDDPRPTFVKIYTADEIHVSSIFIRAGESSTVRLPANTYMIRSAHGENWFGLEELFGDQNAYYQTLLLEGSTTYAFRRNYEYTLTLRDAVDGNVGTRNENRSGF